MVKIGPMYMCDSYKTIMKIMTAKATSMEYPIFYVSIQDEEPDKKFVTPYNLNDLKTIKKNIKEAMNEPYYKTGDISIKLYYDKDTYDYFEIGED